MRQAITKRLLARLGTVDVILFPLHLGCHWAAIRVYPKKGRIERLDSLPGNRLGAQVLLILDLLKKVAMTKFGADSTVYQQWEIYDQTDLGLQTNGTDCGIFLLSALRQTFQGGPFLVDQANTKKARKMILHEVLTSQLVTPWP